MIIRRHHSEDVGFQIAPMIDITWILIIFFMVTMHLAETEFAVEVDLPIASAAEVPLDMNGRVIVNTFEGPLYRLAASGDAWEKVGAVSHKRMVGRLVPHGADAVVAVGGADGTGNVAEVEVIRLAP